MTIIFDLDGTIADSFNFVIDFLAEDAGQEIPSDEARQAYRGMAMMAIAKEMGYHWWQMIPLLIKGRQQMSKVMRRVHPFADMPEVIRKLHAEGHELFIVSSNTVKNVRKFLEAHDLYHYFLEIYGGIGLFGKAPALRRLLKEQNLEVQSAVYIGDELRDVESAQAAKLKVIAVTWGFARPSDLVDHNPTALADEPNDLIRIIEEL